MTGDGSSPGTLTRLIEEVVNGVDGTSPDGTWTDGMRSGTVIGRYELIREVGRGGFGVVWEARDRDLGRAARGVYLVQEFLTGVALARRLDQGRLPLREAIRIAIELARGLAHAHAHGVVHRDLTPGNVQLCEDGQVKLLDLGLAAALGRRREAGGTPPTWPRSSAKARRRTSGPTSMPWGCCSTGC